MTALVAFAVSLGIILWASRQLYGELTRPLDRPLPPRGGWSQPRRLTDGKGHPEQPRRPADGNGR